MSTPLGPLSWTAIGTFASAGVTALMAVFTWMMARATRKAVAQTADALDLDRQMVAQGQDALLPVLELDIHAFENVESGYVPPPWAPGQFLATLTITNHGCGPALVREMTMRNEVDIGGVYDSPTRHAMVPAGGSVTMDLKLASSFNGFPSFPPIAGATESPPPARCVSSFSVWYEDVYGRQYRTRAVFTYEVPCGAVNSLTSRKIIRRSSRFQPHATIPAVTYDLTAQDPSVVNLQEGGCVQPYDGRQIAWYDLQAVDQIRPHWWPGMSVTNNQCYQVLDWAFWFGSDPDITIQVEDRDPFVLVLDPRLIESQQSSPLRVADYKEFMRKRSNPREALTDPSKDLIIAWGLHDHSTLLAELGELYNSARDHISRTLTLHDDHASKLP